MRLETLSYTEKNRWSRPFPDHLDDSRTLVLVFGGSSFLKDPAPLHELAEAFPSAKLAGCSSAGEIEATTIRDDSLTVAVARFEHTDLDLAAAEVAAHESSFEIGRALGNQLLNDRLRSVLVLSDGLLVNGSELVRGLNAALPPTIVTTGGLAGDGDRFETTWVLRERHPRTGWVAAVGFYGDRLKVGHGSRGGWDIFGPERLVTRSRGNVVYEFDGKPALDLYRLYLGELASGLPATALLFPLALRETADDPRYIVRTVQSIDEAERSMTFIGDVPQGSLSQLMRANNDRLVEGAARAADQARSETCDGGATLALAISCVGRRLVLGERTEEELEVVLETLPPHTTQVGFYSYGEISPFDIGPCDLHNQTLTLTTYAEA